MFRVRLVAVHTCIWALSYCFALCLDLEICPIVFLNKPINSSSALARTMVQFSKTIFVNYII